MAPSLTILDVGHGNSAILHEGTEAIVIDACPGTALLQFLVEASISIVRSVLISHADSGHLKGLVGLLDQSQIAVESVFLNSDAAKNTRVWDALIYALEERHRAGDCEFSIELTEGTGFALGDHARVEVLAPRKLLAAKGPGSTDDAGRRITSNTISAVARVSVPGREVLLTGDIDELGWAHLAASGQNLSAEVLVFPHHGGNAGQATVARNAGFARELMAAVEPTDVVFSIGRTSRHANPRPEMVSAVVEARGRVLCTQLSQHCSSTTQTDVDHLVPVFALGRVEGRCCAGTVVIADATLSPSSAEHAVFITASAPTALCR